MSTVTAASHANASSTAGQIFKSPIVNEAGLPADPDNLYYQTVATMLHAAELMNLPKHVQLILAQPKNEIMVHFPVKMDSGEWQLIKGYRVQHNNALGPFKGGLRFHHEVHLDDVKSLAFLMTMKCSLARLPYGGGKGGIRVNPRAHSNDEMERIVRRFTTAIAHMIGPDHDIPAPDVGSTAQHMAWMADTYSFLAQVGGMQNPHAVITGKPVEYGGSQGREKATGQGLVDVLAEMLPELGLQAKGATFATLGYGNVGSWAARLFQDMGAKMITASDHTGFIKNDHGIDAHDLAHYVAANPKGGVAGYPKADACTKEEFYSAKVDVFIPAALEQMIKEPEAKLINAKVVVEGANAPTTPAGERLLLSRGVEVIPAILANAGGVTVSYFEWVQNKTFSSWEVEEVDRKLNVAMVSAAKRTRQARQKYKCDLRTAAYIAALENIAKVYAIRGIFP